MIPLIRLATWNSVPVTNFLSDEQQKQIVADTMVGGATLTKLIGTSAWYAPGAAGAALVESIVRDEKKLFTCCVSLEGEYGQKDICLGCTGNDRSQWMGEDRRLQVECGRASTLQQER